MFVDIADFTEAEYKSYHFAEDNWRNGPRNAAGYLKEDYDAWKVRYLRSREKWEKKRLNQRILTSALTTLLTVCVVVVMARK